MPTTYIKAGFLAMRKRPGLALLLFAVHLTVALFLAAPIGSALNATFGPAGLEDVLDPVLLADFFEHNVGLAPGIASLIGLAVLVLFVWHSTAGVGLAHALRDQAARSFWAGASVWFWKGLGVTALFVASALGWTILMVVAGVGIGLAVSSEVIVFWACLVAVPAVWIAGLAALDLMLDYARIGLVSRDQGVLEAAWFGAKFGMGRWRTQVLYVSWFIPAALLLLLPTSLEIALGASVLTFLLQQALLLGRQFVTVGWMASQVSLHEEEQIIEGGPLIAGMAER